MLSPMTDLDAVNKMLASIGQAPVNTLEAVGIGDANRAKQQLITTACDVQITGWWFNTDDGYTLSPDSDGYIKLPNGALSVDISDSTTNCAMRPAPDGSGTMALYDLDNQTFIWTADVTVRVIWGYDFNDLPASARTYIATAAARRFQAQQVSSTVLDKFNADDEERAWLLLLRDERRNRDTNSFRVNRTLQRFMRRRAF